MMPNDITGNNLPPIEPHNMEAEQGLLGALLVDNRVYDNITGFFRVEYFFTSIHQEIYTAIETAIAQGKTASPVLLKTQFNKHEDLKDLGGGMYLAELAGSIVSVINTKSYAKTIKELHTRRTLISGLRDVIDQAYNSSALEYGNVLESANKCLNDLSDDIPAREHTASSAMIQALEFSKGIKNGTITPVRTGIWELDLVLNGLYSGCLYIIAGRPGMGKTALALNMARNIAAPETGEAIPSAFFSLEMSAMQLGMRLLARDTGIPQSRQMSTYDLAQDEWQRLVNAQAQHSKMPLLIEDCAGTTLSQIISKARKIRRIHGKFVMFIDYLGLIKSDMRSMQMVHQIAEITKGLKELSKELDIPVVLLSQLSREVEKREDKRPLKADLRDSGAIEQDADVILFPYRHEYYLARQEPIKGANEGQAKYENRVNEWHLDLGEAKGKAEIIIAKNRYGIERSTQLRFDGERQLFHDL